VVEAGVVEAPSEGERLVSCKVDVEVVLCEGPEEAGRGVLSVTVLCASPREVDGDRVLVILSTGGMLLSCAEDV